MDWASILSGWAIISVACAILFVALFVDFE